MVAVLGAGQGDARAAVTSVVEAASWEADAASRLRSIKHSWMTRLLHFAAVKVCTPLLACAFGGGGRCGLGGGGGWVGGDPDSLLLPLSIASFREAVRVVVFSLVVYS